MYHEITTKSFVHPTVIIIYIYIYIMITVGCTKDLVVIS